MPTVLLFTFLFSALCLYALAPLLRDQQATAVPNLRTQELLAERDAIVQDLREIQFDFEIGKIDQTEFEEMKHQYESALASILALIDQR